MVPEQDPLAKVDGALPFCCRAEDGRLVINLRQREASFSRFRWQKDGRELRVHFFYNRSFGRKGVGERGSYSKTFRPDYTLVIIPEEFDQDGLERSGARRRKNAGRIAYLALRCKISRRESSRALWGCGEGEMMSPKTHDRRRLERSNASTYTRCTPTTRRSDAPSVLTCCIRALRTLKAEVHGSSATTR